MSKFAIKIEWGGGNTSEPGASAVPISRQV